MWEGVVGIPYIGCAGLEGKQRNTIDENICICRSLTDPTFTSNSKGCRDIEIDIYIFFI